MVKSPTISLCMISLNEAQTIGEAIRSCTGAVDEIIVVDNGSTDGTGEIARSLGARVIEREWTKSYADARNASFAAATSDWILVLDCDERLEPESAKILRQVISEATTEALMVQRIDESPGGESITKVMRIGQRDKFVPMVRRIHERFVRPPKSIADSPIRIQHTGYKAGSNLAKLARYREMLELQLTETPEDHYLLVDLLHTYWLLNDPRWERVMESASAKLDRSKPPEHVLVAVLLELAMLRKEGTAPGAISAENAGELAERWYPNYLPLVALRMRQAIAKKNPDAAIRLAESALAQSAAAADALPFKRGYIEADIHLLKGVALTMANQRDEAIQHFQIAAQHPEIAVVAKKNLHALGAG